MKFSEDDFKKLYAEMPDEELRSLQRSELTDLARQCYDAEVARRGLTARAAPKVVRAPIAPVAPREMAPEPEPDEALAQEAEVEEEEDLVPAARFATREEARAARGRLQRAAIPVFVEDDTDAGGGFRLLVALSDVGAAREVLGRGWAG